MKQQPKTVNLLLLLFVLVLILASVSSSLFGGRENAGLTYSGVLDLFEQEQVESFVLTGNSLALHLREPYKGSSDVTVKLGDVETIAAQKADGTLVSYNYLPSTTPWYRTVLPYIVGLGLIVLLWFFLAARANGGGPGGMAQFTHANARFGIPTNQTVTFQDVAGGKGRAGRDRRIPARPEALHRHGRENPEGRSARRPSGHRQNADRPRSCRGSRGIVPVNFRL